MEEIFHKKTMSFSNPYGDYRTFKCGILLYCGLMFEGLTLYNPSTR